MSNSYAPCRCGTLVVGPPRPHWQTMRCPVCGTPVDIPPTAAAAASVPHMFARSGAVNSQGRTSCAPMFFLTLFGGGIAFLLCCDLLFSLAIGEQGAGALVRSGAFLLVTLLSWGVAILGFQRGPTVSGWLAQCGFETEERRRSARQMAWAGGTCLLVVMFIVPLVHMGMVATEFRERKKDGAAGPEVAAGRAGLVPAAAGGNGGSAAGLVGGAAGVVGQTSPKLDPLPVDPGPTSFLPDRLVRAGMGTLPHLPGGASPFAFRARPSDGYGVEVHVFDLSRDEPARTFLLNETPLEERRPGYDRLSQGASGSPDGTMIAVEPDNPDRSMLVIWTLAATPEVRLKIPLKKSYRDRRVAFVNQDTVLVEQAPDHVEWWSLSQGSFVRSAPFGPHAFTPGGRYLAIAHQGVLGFLEAATGASLANVSICAGRGDIQSLAFSGDGRRLVVTGKEHASNWRFLELWDLVERKRRYRTALPTELRINPPPTHWLDRDLVLVDDLVVDVERGRVAWRYVPSPGVCGTAGGRIWVRGNSGAEMLLGALPAVSADLRARLPALTSRSFASAMSGQPFGLDVRFATAPPDAKLKDPIIKAVTQSAEAVGHHVLIGAKPMLQVVVTDRDLGGFVTKYEQFVKKSDKFGTKNIGSPIEIQIPNRQLHCQVSLIDEQGGVAWRDEVTVGVNDVDDLYVEGLLTSMEKETLTARWRQLPQALVRLRVPRELVDFSHIEQVPFVPPNP